MTCRMMLATSVWGLTLTAQRTHVGQTRHSHTSAVSWDIDGRHLFSFGVVFPHGLTPPTTSQMTLVGWQGDAAAVKGIQGLSYHRNFPCRESWPPLSMSFSRVGWPWLWPWTRSGPKPRCGLRLAVGQSLMASVCHSVSQNWSTAVWYLLIITHINLPINITVISNNFFL